jgi:hypothetical protein
LLPFAASFFCNWPLHNKMWRKRVGVEPTTRLAKSRINGFEGHEDHRTPFASDFSKSIRLRGLLNVRNFAPFRDSAPVIPCCSALHDLNP